MKNSFDKIDCFVGLFDILGFRNLIETHKLEEVAELYSKVKKYFEEMLNYANSLCNRDIVKFYNFSDTFLIHTKTKDDINFQTLLYACDALFLGFNEAAQNNNIAIRGAISSGEIIAVEGIIIGQPIIEAFGREKQQEWIGCWISDKCLIIINAISAQGLNFLIGYTGQISLGQGAFMAIGAYFTAIMCNTYNYSFWFSFLLVPIVTGFVGILVALPALRLKGLYLAILTLAFHMVVALGMMSLDITGGYQGINVPNPRIGSWVLNTEVHRFYLALVSGLLFFIFSFNLSRTKIYRAFIAIKEREISAQSMGISLWGFKTFAFFLASAYAGVSGSLFSITMGHITPNHFPLMVSIEFIMMTIVGGPGSIMGILLGTVLITVMPYCLLALIQTLSTCFPMAVVHFADLKIIVYGIIIVVFLLYVPAGFHGLLMKAQVYFRHLGSKS